MSMAARIVNMVFLLWQGRGASAAPPGLAATAVTALPHDGVTYDLMGTGGSGRDVGSCCCCCAIEGTGTGIGGVGASVGAVERPIPLHEFVAGNTHDCGNVIGGCTTCAATGSGVTRDDIGVVVEHASNEDPLSGAPLDPNAAY